MFPKNLRIKLYRRELRESHLFSSFQRKLLQNEINYKKRLLIKATKIDDQSFRNVITSISRLGTSCINLWLNHKQDCNINKIKVIHNRKLQKLGISLVHWILILTLTKYFFNRILTTNEKRILSLGLDFGLPISQLHFCNNILSFEKLFDILKDIDF